MFADQRTQLFGREPAIAFLRDRASRAGLTAVVARPLMGKTWTLLEVARREVAGGDCLVGYHESKGAEGSHLLYAVANLYAEWLADSGMRQQAVSLWERHKDSLVPRMGQLAGLLFEKLGGKTLVPDGVASIVRSAFDGLAVAQDDLASGGLRVPSLSYDDALSITALVEKVSGRRVVLILDAWEKSPSMRAEAATLEALLKHPTDWPRTHVFLGIRSPDVAAAGASDDALRNARLFEKLSPAALVHDLGPIDVEAAVERARLVAYLRATVAATRALSDDALVARVDGFPGVVGRWTSDAVRDAMRTVADLDREALTAQTLRYLEFDALLPGLRDAHRTCAARLSFLPRLDADRWPAFRDIVMADVADEVVDDLVDRHVLDNETYPSFGHDTRHAAARNWFADHHRSLTQRVAEELVDRLASRIRSDDVDSVLRIGAIAAAAPFLRRVVASRVVRTLIDAAVSAFDETPAVFDPAFDADLAEAVRLSPAYAPLVAICRVARGARRADRGDFDGALADYDAVIADPAALSRQRGQALVNRGILFSRRRDRRAAIVAYDAALAATDAPPDEIARALINRAAERAATGDRAGARADLDRQLAMVGLPAEFVATALNNRGGLRFEDGDPAAAIADFDAAIALPDAPAAQRAEAFYNRGVVRAASGDDAAIADYSAAIDAAGVGTEAWFRAIVNRAAARRQRGDDDGALADYAAVVERAEAPALQVAKALAARATLWAARGDDVAADRDWTRLAASSEAPTDLRTMALRQRAGRHEAHGDLAAAIDDVDALLSLPDVADAAVAGALCARGLWRFRLGDESAAEADFDAVVAMPAAASDRVAVALGLRAQLRDARRDTDGAVADYTALLDHPGATRRAVAKATYNLGVIQERGGDRAAADARYAGVLALADAPPDVVAAAREALDRPRADGTPGA